MFTLQFNMCAAVVLLKSFNAVRFSIRIKYQTRKKPSNILWNCKVTSSFLYSNSSQNHHMAQNMADLIRIIRKFANWRYAFDFAFSYFSLLVGNIWKFANVPRWLTHTHSISNMKNKLFCDKVNNKDRHEKTNLINENGKCRLQKFSAYRMPIIWIWLIQLIFQFSICKKLKFSLKQKSGHVQLDSLKMWWLISNTHKRSEMAMTFVKW